MGKAKISLGCKVEKFCSGLLDGEITIFNFILAMWIISFLLVTSPIWIVPYFLTKLAEWSVQNGRG